jgi:hypothetical protein
MSLEHYVHCLDWLLPHFLASSKLLGKARARDIATLARRAESGVYSAIADPDRPLKKATVDCNSQPKSATADQQPQLSIPVQVFRERFPEIASSYETRHQQAAKQDDSCAPSILDSWSVLFLYQTTQESLLSIVERFGVKPEEADEMIRRVQALHRIMEPRGNKVMRHKELFQLPEKSAKNSKPGLLYPKLPRSGRSEQFIRDLEGPLMICAQKYSSLTRSVLTYYVNNIWSSENILAFRDPADPKSAADYLNFLKELEFGNPGNAPIRFISFDKAQISKARNDWQQALKVTNREWAGVEIRNPLYAPCRANRKWLSIGPRLNSDEDEGYRFLMIMAAIVFGFS